MSHWMMESMNGRFDRLDLYMYNTNITITSRFPLPPPPFRLLEERAHTHGIIITRNPRCAAGSILCNVVAVKAHADERGLFSLRTKDRAGFSFLAQDMWLAGLSGHSSRHIYRKVTDSTPSSKVLFHKKPRSGCNKCASSSARSSIVVYEGSERQRCRLFFLPLSSHLRSRPPSELLFC